MTMHAAKLRDLDCPAPVWRVHGLRIIEISGDDAFELALV
jgi:hypothetical protein